MHPAQARREQQLRQLVLEGVPLRTLGKSGHWIIGPLHIYTASGRWLSEATGRRGRLNGHPIRQIVKIEYCRSPLRDEQPTVSGRPPRRSKNGAAPGARTPHSEGAYAFLIGGVARLL
jgi:hypothetical protein